MGHRPEAMGYDTRRSSVSSLRPEPAPLSVSEFLEKVNELLVEQVAWVEGEVADVRVSQGKFLHFDLKDSDALVHCFGLLFRIRTPLEEGMKVRVWGLPKVYPKYGKFSLTVEIVEPSGEGALRRAYELLKAKLDAEGLFALERKRPLPRFPERIGLVTSPEAAAYADFLKVLKARRGGVEILFVPVLVQGREAPGEILQAIEFLNEEHPLLDALILVRGGGSLEELQAFNDESVVRALARSRIPTVVGVGHERDVSLADLVADVRASTPSNAAELLTPTRTEILGNLTDLVGRLRTSVGDELRHRETSVASAVRVMRESAYDAVQHVQSLAHRMGAVGRLFTLTIDSRLKNVQQLGVTLHGNFAQRFAALKEHLSATERLLATLHPQHILARGYSITRRSQGEVIRDAQAVAPGEQITTQLSRGTLSSTVDPRSPWSPKNPPRSPRTNIPGISPGTTIGPETRRTSSKRRGRQLVVRGSRKRTKNSNRSLPPSNQGTLISNATSPSLSGD